MGYQPLQKEVTKEAVCPFCGLALERPKELPGERVRAMPLGQCSGCGAVCAYDATGHNLGAAFSEALVFACNDDWGLAWNLLPDEDYLQAVVERYDLETNRVVPQGTLGDRRVRGALFFVRLQEDIQELTRNAVQQKLRAARPATPRPGAPEPPPDKTAAGSLSKREVEALIADYQLDPVIAAARHDRKIMRHLQRLLCAGDELVRLRAAEALGKVAGALVTTDPTAVVSVFQGLFNHFADSSASNWGSVDAIGEVIANAPDLFAGYIAKLFPLLTEESVRPAAVRALARIAAVRPDAVRRRIFFPLLPFVRDKNPQTRGYIALLLGRMGGSEARQLLEMLRDDVTPVEIYEAGRMVTKTVGQIADEALTQLNG
ncbi:DVU0298 family protein [Thermodesulfitimonas sp.]